MKEYEKLAEKCHQSYTPINGVRMSGDDFINAYIAGFLKAREMALELICIRNEINEVELESLGEKEV